MSGSIRNLKSGTRVLGIVETRINDEISLFVGVVTTKFLLEDVAFEKITVGGMDATDGIINIRNKIGRQDVRIILLSGRIVAGYNIVDVVRAYEAIGVPIVVVPYLRPKKRIADIIRRLFDDYEERLSVYYKVKEYSAPLIVGGRLRVGIVIGIEPKLVESFLNRILIGKTPFPIYVADRIARGIRRDFGKLINNS